MSTILSVQNLSVQYKNQSSCSVNALSFDLEKGETLCLHGNSGCGKSTVVWTIMGRIRSMGGTATGNIMYDGLDLVTCTEKQWREIRWKKLALVPQSSMNSFNPVYTIGKTLDEMYRVHMPNLSKQEKRERKLQLMSMVHLEERVLNCYPHELSGGMRQRAAIAVAIMLSPELLILDEATSFIDTRTELQIQKALDAMMEGRTTFIVAHRLSTIENADTILVMDKGKILEQGNHQDLLAKKGYYYMLYNSQFNINN